MIEEILLKYKNLTEAIIVNVKNDLEGEYLLKERGELILQLLKNKTFNKEEIKSVYINLEIQDLDEVLKLEIDRAIERNKKAIQEMKLRKNANQAYGNNVNSINIFNKKI